MKEDQSIAALKTNAGSIRDWTQKAHKSVFFQILSKVASRRSIFWGMGQL